MLAWLLVASGFVVIDEDVNDEEEMIGRVVGGGRGRWI